VAFWPCTVARCLHLSGLPLRLVARVGHKLRPTLDLSGLRLTRLSLDCRNIKYLLRNSSTDCKCLWPVRLPGSLEELHLSGLDGDWLERLAWAQHPSAGLAGRLLRLHTLHVTCMAAGEPLRIAEVPLLDGFPVSPAFEVHDSSGGHVDIHNNLFGRARSVRVAAGGCVFLWDCRGDVATFVDRLCPAGLQAA